MTPLAQHLAAAAFVLLTGGLMAVLGRRLIMRTAGQGPTVDAAAAAMVEAELEAARLRLTAASQHFRNLRSRAEAG